MNETSSRSHTILHIDVYQTRLVQRLLDENVHNSISDKVQVE
jgi:hypothetical protein